MTMQLATPSGRLCAKLDLVFHDFKDRSRRIWDHPEVRQLYPVYLRTMHMVVRAAVPLMRTARDAATARGPADALCTELAGYYDSHMREEAGHDEWLLQDLGSTGVDPLDATRRMPSAAVAELVGAQYYWLCHHHPVSLLGHIAAMEIYHPPAGFARHLAGLTGYPSTAFRAIRRHEKLDVMHRDELLALLDTLPLEPRHEASIGMSALHTLQAGIGVMDEILSAPIESRTQGEVEVERRTGAVA